MKVTTKKAKGLDAHIIDDSNKKIVRTITDFLNTDYKDYTKFCQLTIGNKTKKYQSN